VRFAIGGATVRDRSERQQRHRIPAATRPLHRPCPQGGAGGPRPANPGDMRAAWKRSGDITGVGQTGGHSGQRARAHPRQRPLPSTTPLPNDPDAGWHGTHSRDEADPRLRRRVDRRAQPFPDGRTRADPPFGAATGTPWSHPSCAQKLADPGAAQTSRQRALMPNRGRLRARMVMHWSTCFIRNIERRPGAARITNSPSLSRSRTPSVRFSTRAIGSCRPRVWVGLALSEFRRGELAADGRTKTSKATFWSSC